MEAQVPTIGTSLLAAELASVKRCGNWRPLAGHVRPHRTCRAPGDLSCAANLVPLHMSLPAPSWLRWPVPGNFPKHDDKLPPPGWQVCQC